MSEFEGHTPGPWEINDDQITPGPFAHFVWALGNNRVPVARVYGDIGRDEHANARLIAAAPSLRSRAERAEKALDDLVMALDLPGDHCELEPALERARAVLAQTGGENDG